MLKSSTKLGRLWNETWSGNCQVRINAHYVLHIYRCRDHLAIAHRNQQLILLRKQLAKSNSNPLITNYIIRALRQYTGGFQTSNIPIPDPKLDPNTIDYESLNSFFEIGVDNIISGVISSDITDVQKCYASQYNVGKKIYSFLEQVPHKSITWFLKFDLAV